MRAWRRGGRVRFGVDDDLAGAGRFPGALGSGGFGPDPDAHGGAADATCGRGVPEAERGSPEGGSARVRGLRVTSLRRLLAATWLAAQVVLALGPRRRRRVGGVAGALSNAGSSAHEALARRRGADAPTPSPGPPPPPPPGRWSVSEKAPPAPPATPRSVSENAPSAPVPPSRSVPETAPSPPTPESLSVPESAPSAPVPESRSGPESAPSAPAAPAPAPEPESPWTALASSPPAADPDVAREPEAPTGTSPWSYWGPVPPRAEPNPPTEWGAAAGDQGWLAADVTPADPKSPWSRAQSSADARAERVPDSLTTDTWGAGETAQSSPGAARQAPDETASAWTQRVAAAAARDARVRQGKPAPAPAGGLPARPPARSGSRRRRKAILAAVVLALIAAAALLAALLADRGSNTSAGHAARAPLRQGAERGPLATPLRHLKEAQAAPTRAAPGPGRLGRRPRERREAVAQGSTRASRRTRRQTVPANLPVGGERSSCSPQCSL